MCLSLQLHSWRRHLHKFDDMDEAAAKANAKALKERVLEVRAARAKELGLEVTTTEPTKVSRWDPGALP